MQVRNESNRPWIFGWDVDGTMRGKDAAANAALAKLHQTIARAQADCAPVFFGPVTGRVRASLKKLAEEDLTLGAILRAADFKITGVGTEIALRGPGEAFKPVAWPLRIKEWGRLQLENALCERPELHPQPAYAQNPYKLSFDVTGIPEEHHATYLHELDDYLGGKGLDEFRPHLVYSSGRNLDVLPREVHKGTALWHAANLVTSRFAIGEAEPWRHDYPLLVAAGDSTNDCDMLAAADRAILPGNADESLVQWAADHLSPARYHLAEGHCAEGIMEGMAHFGFPYA